MDVLQIWGPSILAVIVATALSGGMSRHIEHERRQGIRALLSQELLHNETALNILARRLEMLINAGNIRHTLANFSTNATPPHWERSRWSLPDVGAALKLP